MGFGGISFSTIFTAAVAAVVTVATGGVGFLATAGFGMAAQAAIVFGASLAFSAVTSALAPKPKIPSLPSFSSRARDRLRQIRQAITPWRIIYGEIRVSGPVTFVEATNDNKYLHMVITLASHACEDVSVVYLDDYPVYVEDIDPDGVMQSGRYAALLLVQIDLGTTTQPFPDLVDQVENWTADHIQAGHTKAYIRLEYDYDTYPNGIPNFSFLVKGKKVFDTRTSTTAWSPNPALAIRDYLTLPNRLGGVGASTAEFNDTFTTAAANICDEIVSTIATSATVGSVSSTTNAFTFSDTSTLVFQTGDRVTASTTDTLPTGIDNSTPYYVIADRAQGSDVRCKLATSYLNSLAGTAVSVTDEGEGTHTIIKTGEPRYTCNGAIDTDSPPKGIIEELLSAMGGRATYVGGQWSVFAAAYTAPTITITDDDLIDGVAVSTRSSLRHRANAVKGVYVSPYNFNQPSDYPPVTNATYQTNDGGTQRFRELDLSYTSRPSMAQRLAKIDLERGHQEITAKIVTNLSGFQVQAGDTVAVTNTRFGWSAKVFEVATWKIVSRQFEGSPFLGVEMNLQETASGVFDWAAGEETVIDLARNTSLPNVFAPIPPTGLTVTEQLYDTRASAGVKARAVVSWTASTDGFVDDYQLEYKRSSDANWTVATRQLSTNFTIDDIAPNTYDFRVKAINVRGISSIYATEMNQELTGLLAAPASPQGVTISTIGGLAIIRWTQSTDLDVRSGGKVVFRHDQLTAGASWTTSVSIGDAVPGSETVAVLPLKSGTYLCRFFDGSGVKSDVSSVSTKQATALAYTNVSTLTASPSFSGVKSNLIVEGGSLELTGASLMDDWTDVDSAPSWDYIGGVNASGTYTFDGGFDFGSVGSYRMTSSVTALISDVLDNFDARTALMDTWTDFDGTDQSNADVQVWARHTDDDPGGSPTWGSWERLDSAEFSARGFQFQARFTSDDPVYNIAVSQLSVTADQVA